MKTRIWLVLAAGAVALACKESPPAPAATGSAMPSPPPVATEIDSTKLGVFAQLPKSMPSEANPVTDAKVALGRMLYFEKRVSKNQDRACQSCHDLGRYGVDGEPFSVGHKGQRGGRNSPTVYNAATHIAQFWDGRAPDVEKQALGPVLNPVEMAMPNEKNVLAVLRSMPAYVDAFKKAFPDDEDPVSFENFGKAIGAFERTLVTPSRFDAYLAGDKKALDEQEKAGLVAFMDTGCTACHNGANLGGGSFQRVGAVKPWPNQKDLGRYDVTKQDADKMMFKVPGLRNVEKTGPYFHDASAKSLDDAVAMMADHQLGRKLEPDKVRAIVKFLGALTGTLPADVTNPPELPASTAKTPKADPS